MAKVGDYLFDSLYNLERHKIMNTQTLFEFVGEGKMLTSDCIAIAFRRKAGTNAVSINGYPLEENETLRIAQNVGDVDRSQYQVSFTSADNTGELYVFRTIGEEC